MLKELSSAVDGRHVLAWSSDPVEQKGWVGAGMAGTLSRDSLLVGLNNFGGTKLDQFIDVDATLSVGQGRQGVRPSPCNCASRTTRPSACRPTSRAPIPVPTTSRASTRVRSPSACPAPPAQISLSGTAPLTVSGADGPTQVDSAAVDLRRGEQRVVTIRFRLPAGANEIEVEPSARFPAIRWHFNGQSWADTSARSISW